MDSGITPITPQQEPTLAAQAQKEGYFIRVLIAFDMFVNVIFGGNNDETISSRSARAATEGKLWGKILSNFLDLFQADHGAQAIVGDLTRADDVESLEENSGDIPK